MNTNFTMKELPESEQPYEKFEKYGPISLSDAELLAIILRCGHKDRSALHIARDILRHNQKNLLNLNHFSLENLMKIPGIGKVKAIQLKCIAELSRRMSCTTYEKKLQVNDPKTIADYYMERLRHETREHLYLAMFDTKHNFIGDELISVGTINSTLVSPREIFLKALAHQAVHIIILHNHPSGDPTPSQEDIRVTHKILKCGELLDIYLSDHIIIGDNKYVSLRENGMFNGKE